MACILLQLDRIVTVHLLVRIMAFVVAIVLEVGEGVDIDTESLKHRMQSAGIGRLVKEGKNDTE